MYHSITFDEKNTWDDWHLIPKTRPLFNPPPIKSTYVEIPGGDGILDLTTSLTGRVLYKNRTGSLEFYVDTDFKDWVIIYSEIMNYLHGKRAIAILEDDPNYFYEGRFTVNSWKSDQQRSTVVIDYDVHPYKKEVNSSIDEWLWDTFNFETDIIRCYKDIMVNGTLEVTVIGTYMPVIPIIDVSSSTMSVSFNGMTYELSQGLNQIENLIIQNGENLLAFSGQGIVTIVYRNRYETCRT